MKEVKGDWEVLVLVCEVVWCWIGCEERKRKRKKDEIKMETEGSKEGRTMWYRGCEDEGKERKKEVWYRGCEDERRKEGRQCGTEVVKMKMEGRKEDVKKL